MNEKNIYECIYEYKNMDTILFYRPESVFTNFKHIFNMENS